MKKSTRILISLLGTLLIAGIGYYVMLPAINGYSEEFWILLALVSALFFILYSIIGLLFGEPLQMQKNWKFTLSLSKKFKTLVGILVGLPIAVVLVGSLFSATFFHAKAYADIIQVEDSVFAADMPETKDAVRNIALTDSATAKEIGERKLGELSHVVSQYVVNGTYYQINYAHTPQKISTLEYADFFKWFNNRDEGVPGYIMVDTVNSQAAYHEFAEPVRYTDSAFFSEDLHRKLRFEYPTKIFGSYSFEIDEEGRPFYIVSCMKPKIGLFGAKDVSEVIIFNPVDGSSQLYALSDVPSWVDNVYTGTLATQKYDWYGTLKNGFWNSVIGNRDCKVTTDDYGYIIIEDDVWFFTGVTSVVSDESNIGFLISNARTGEYKFYTVNGAEEYSAMASAEGEVQEKGYDASFPSLINVSGQPTYIMTLKDEGGLIRLYALVHVEHHHIVATDAKQETALEKYIDLLQKENIIATNEPEVPSGTEAEITVKALRFVTVDGQSVLYITDTEGMLYKVAVSNDETVMLLSQGDHIQIRYADGQHEKIKTLLSWSYVAKTEE